MSVLRCQTLKNVHGCTHGNRHQQSNHLASILMRFLSDIEAGQELPLLFSLMNLLSCLPCCACKCFSYRADLLYDTQDNFQHRSLALACFSSQPLTWHHVETPQNFLSSRPGQRHHSAREKLQHQCFTSALSAVVRPLITFQWYSSKMLQPKQTFQNPKLLVYDYCT